MSIQGGHDIDKGDPFNVGFFQKFLCAALMLQFYAVSCVNCASTHTQTHMKRLCTVAVWILL